VKVPVREPIPIRVMEVSARSTTGASPDNSIIIPPLPKVMAHGASAAKIDGRDSVPGGSAYLSSRRLMMTRRGEHQREGGRYDGVGQPAQPQPEKSGMFRVAIVGDAQPVLLLLPRS